MIRLIREFIDQLTNDSFVKPFIRLKAVNLICYCCLFSVLFCSLLLFIYKIVELCAK